MTNEQKQDFLVGALRKIIVNLRGHLAQLDMDEPNQTDSAMSEIVCDMGNQRDYLVTYGEVGDIS